MEFDAEFQYKIMMWISELLTVTNDLKWLTNREEYNNIYGKTLVSLLSIISLSVCIHTVMNNMDVIAKGLEEKKNILEIMQGIMVDYVNSNSNLQNKHLNVLRKMLKTGILAVLGAFVFFIMRRMKTESEKWWQKQVRRYYMDWMSRPIEGTFDRIYTYGLFKNLNRYFIKKKHSNKGFFDSVNATCFKSLITTTTVLFRAFLNIDSDKNEKTIDPNNSTLCGSLFSMVQPFVSWDPAPNYNNNSGECRKHLGYMFLREMSGCIQRAINEPK
jgi:hypothetical protein